MLVQSVSLNWQLHFPRNSKQQEINIWSTMCTLYNKLHITSSQSVWNLQSFAPLYDDISDRHLGCQSWWVYKFLQYSEHCTQHRENEHSPQCTLNVIQSLWLSHQALHLALVNLFGVNQAVPRMITTGVEICHYVHVQGISSETRMWAGAQHDGRPAE